MDILFPDIDFKQLDNCKPPISKQTHTTAYNPPTAKQIKDWLNQTSGILTNELRIALGLKPLEDRNNIKYTGDLTIQQQIDIFHQMQ